MEPKSNLSNPFFSIIIPIYNTEKYLNRCLASIRSQLFTDYEVILVDDGSTDSSPAICQNYAAKDNRYRYVRKENGGAFHARRFGADFALGNYVLFMDADDFYTREDALSILHRELKDETLCAMQFGYLKQYNHLRRRGVSVAESFTVNAEDFKNNEYPRLVCSFYDPSHLTTNAANKVYHRRLLKNLPDFQNERRIFMGDDQIMNLFLLENCQSFRFIPDVIYGYQQGSGGTSKFSKSTMADLDAIKRYQLQFLDRYDYANREKMEGTLYAEMAGWFYIYIQDSIDHLDDDEILNLIKNVLQYDTFKLAHEYFLDKSAKNWEGANLMRKADPAAYLQSAKNIHRKFDLKREIKKVLKRIYSVI